MFVFHFRLRWKVAAAAAAAIVLAVTLALVLPGCRSSEAPIAAGTEQQRQDYLQSLGWAVGSEPVETLDLQLPEKLEGEWADYAALQAGQGLDFASCAGKAVRRYTYIVGNYPGIPKGVQVNLYVCGDVLAGGDVIATGANGFRAGLAFPETAKE